jgi:predicted O-linked N-acetylglucosamine transferase (SPINDLY family)
MRLQQAGQLAEAEKIYRRVLEADANNADAHHLLGTLATEAGQLQTAIEHFTTAIRHDPSQAAFHVNLGEAHRRRGDVAQAIACNRRALQLDPRGAHANLGQLYAQQGDARAAVECYRALVRLSPDDPWASSLLGQALVSLGRFDDAETWFRRAADLAPDDARAHYNLAAVLQAQSRWEEAAGRYQAALQRNPEHFEAHNNLGTVLQKLGATDEAEQHYRRALGIDPNSVAALNNLGALLVECDCNAGSVADVHAPSDARATSAGGHVALGVGLLEAAPADEALGLFRRAIELDPDSAAAHNNLGICWKAGGQLDRAIESFRTAIRLQPDSSEFHGNLLYALNYHPDYDPPAVFAEHRAWGRKHADPLTAPCLPHANDRAPDRRLRIGYVSGQFASHAVSFFTEPILASHDRERLEVYCYSNVARADGVTHRLRRYAERWREIQALDDDQAADLVRQDQIDILVDLAGHIGENRLLVFARKPAPIQVTYIGYQNTTGMAAMDYRLTDEWADPRGVTDAFYTEKLVRLPRCFFCYQPSADAPAVNSLPALANRFVTFGSLNNLAKITPRVLAAWAAVLRAVPKSRLVLLTNVTQEIRDYVKQAFDAERIDAARIELCRRRPRRAYLDLISQVDIALDPFPMNGHTTTCDALWQGVPVVTLAGRTYASRFGSSAHVNLGLRELIARSPEEYVEIASRLAGDVERLGELRAGLRERIAASPLLDFAGFTRNLEAAYRQMWVAWCAGAPGPAQERAQERGHSTF